MKAMLLLATILVSGPSWAQGISLTISDQNSNLIFTIDDPIYNFPNNSGNPVQLPRKLEWTVDGRRILVYPSSPFAFLDIGHIHPDAHVAANQIHAQGPLLGFESGATTGTVTGGIVYSVQGGAVGSGISRISEKVDIHNKSGAAVPVLLTGLGFNPALTQSSLEVPDFSGLNVTGTTVILIQGNTQTGSLTDGPPFAPLTVLPVISFSGFNPLLNQNYNLPDGAFLTMITELNVARRPLTLTLIPWLIVVALAAIVVVSWRRRRQR